MVCEKSELKMGVALGKIPPLALNTFSQNPHCVRSPLLGGRTNITTCLPTQKHEAAENLTWPKLTEDRSGPEFSHMSPSWQLLDPRPT